MLKGRKIMQHVGKALRGAGKAAQQAGLGGTVGEALRRLAKRQGAMNGRSLKLRRRRGKSSTHQPMT